MSPTVSMKLRKVAEQATQRPDWVFRSLAHQIDADFLREAFRRTRRDGAPGVDGMTVKVYERDLDTNLTELHQRLREGRYEAPPVKRGWVPKEDGTKRPIGMPVLEDKIVQRAVAMMLGAIYEQDFRDCSYGYREGRSPHQALRVLRDKALRWNTRWILDADIKGFFDAIPHAQLREVLEKRVKDGSIIRLIGKWLNAGVMEDGHLHYPEEGTPQGGVISPMLANIFLHEVLDEWFEDQIRPKLRGRASLIRFADDFVMGFEEESDARRVLSVLSKRFERYGLTIHPEKTKLVPFGRPTSSWAYRNETFDFLGFTHYWGQTRQGGWTIKRRTARKRLKRTLRNIWTWCRKHRHLEFDEQHRKLSAKLRGHIQYYGVRCNSEALRNVLYQARRSWRYWLARRSQKNAMPWARFNHLSRFFPLPRIRIVHPDC